MSRPVLTLGLLALLGAAPAAASDTTAPEAAILGDPVRGEVAYAGACAECHRSAARLMARVPGADAAARGAWLAAFLADHHAPEPQARADIIAWLVAR